MTMPAGRRRWSLDLAAAGPAVPSGDGSYTATPVPLDPPTAWGAVEPATGRNMQRLFSQTVISTATHRITIPYHAGVTTGTIVTFRGRTLSVVGVASPDERQIETVLACVEAVR